MWGTSGLCLGPILYIPYNSPLHSISSSHGVLDHLYADDDQQYKSFRFTPDAADQTLALNSLSACIADLRCWAPTNRLKFTDGKNDALVASSSYSRNKLLPIPFIVGDTPIFPFSNCKKPWRDHKLSSHFRCPCHAFVRKPSITYDVFLASRNFSFAPPSLNYSIPLSSLILTIVIPSLLVFLLQVLIGYNVFRTVQLAL